MKRYIEEQEMLVLFFTAYFFYGKFKYGDRERGDIRLARLAACRGVMEVCRAWMARPEPLLRTQFESRFEHLEAEASVLADSLFKTSYLETLAALRKAARDK